MRTPEEFYLREDQSNISDLELPSWLSMENGSEGDETGVRAPGDVAGPNAGGHREGGAGLCQSLLPM